MKKRHLFLAAVLVCFWAHPVQAAPSRFTLAGPSELIFHADTRLHKFSGTTKTLQGHFKGDWEENRLLETGRVRIPIDTIETGNTARDHALQYTLRQKEMPDVTFDMEDVTPVPGGDGAVRRYRVKGTIEIAGVKKQIEWTALAHRENGLLVIDGEFPLKISDFNLKFPPMARWIGVKDDVLVEFKSLWREEALDG